jgi:hypothetical protein
MKKVILGLMVVSAPSVALADFDCKAAQGDTALHVELDGATKIGYVTVHEENATSLLKGSYAYDAEFLSQKFTVDLEGESGKLVIVKEKQFCGRAGCWDSKPLGWNAKWSGKQGETWFSCHEAK